jgi:hypothetical protein
MTAAGDAVLAVALGEVGYVEGPNNSTKYWDWYGGNYGPWCGVFDMWCQDQAGYPTCADFVLVSNGTVHGYSTGGDGATGVEAQRTLDLQPGDSVLFSWEPWEFRDGVPTCVGEWDGYPAGDHVGLFAYWVDQGAGRFAAVEGNTSDGSWDNGGMVLLREDRWTSQVCGWWRQEAIASGAEPGPEPAPEEEDEDMYRALQVGTDGPWKDRIFMVAGSVAMAVYDPAILDNCIAYGLCKPGITTVQEWDIYNAFTVVDPSGVGVRG